MLGQTNGMSKSKASISVPEPSYNDVFYATSNGRYRGHWHDGTLGSRLGDVPPISAVLGERPTVKKPVRPLMTTARCVLGTQMLEEQKAREADKVISADVVPKVFPVRSDQCSYPQSGKKGAKNPLYATSSQAYGNEVPMDHQLPDRFFPSTNKFTKGFVDGKPRYTGLNTAASLSRVHKALDEHY